MIDALGPIVDFETLADADRYLREQGFSAFKIETDDHYAVYMKGDQKAELGPGSAPTTWRATITKQIRHR